MATRLEQIAKVLADAGVSQVQFIVVVSQDLLDTLEGKLRPLVTSVEVEEIDDEEFELSVTTE